MTAPATRNIPSLDAFLADEPRCDGFEIWVEALLRVEAAQQRAGGGDGDLAAVARLMCILGVAAVEGCAIETRHGRPFAGTLALLARVMGNCCMAALASGAADHANLRSLAPLLTEEFRIGAKMMADQIEEAREASEAYAIGAAGIIERIEHGSAARD